MQIDDGQEQRDVLSHAQSARLRIRRCNDRCCSAQLRGRAASYRKLKIRIAAAVPAGSITCAAPASMRRSGNSATWALSSIGSVFRLRWHPATRPRWKGSFSKGTFRRLPFDACWPSGRPPLASRCQACRLAHPEWKYLELLTKSTKWSSSVRPDRGFSLAIRGCGNLIAALIHRKFRTFSFRHTF